MYSAATPLFCEKCYRALPHILFLVVAAVGGGGGGSAAAALELLF